MSSLKAASVVSRYLEPGETIRAAVPGYMGVGFSRQIFGITQKHVICVKSNLWSFKDIGLLWKEPIENVALSTNIRRMGGSIAYVGNNFVTLRRSGGNEVKFNPRTAMGINSDADSNCEILYSVIPGRFDPKSPCQEIREVAPSSADDRTPDGSRRVSSPRPNQASGSSAPLLNPSNSIADPPIYMWFWIFLMRYLDFSGRSRRKEFWWTAAVSGAIGLTLTLLDSALGWNAGGLGHLVLAYDAAIFIPSIALSVRRLHDTEHGARSLFWVLLPIVGWVILLVRYVTEGTPGDNRYGPDPMSVSALSFVGTD